MTRVGAGEATDKSFLVLFFKKGLFAFDLLVAWSGCFLLLSLLACVLSGIITRALGEPLIWTDEGARFLMVWLACTGWMIATRRRAHVRIRFFQSLLPPRGWRAAEVVIQAGVAVLGVTIAWFGVALVGKNIDLDATSLPLSMAFLYVPLIPAGLVTACQGVAEMVRG